MKLSQSSSEIEPIFQPEWSSESQLYPEKTWSLLQVYHFQELSRTSIRDAIFERDGRYVQLKKDLQEEVNKLSPAQLLGSLFVTVVRGFSLEEDIDLKISWQNKTVCLNVFDVSCSFTWCVYDVLI